MNSFDPLSDLPLGFGMALAQDMAAMRHFADLSPDQQRDVIDQTHRIHSKAEMSSFVRSLQPNDLAP